MKLAPGTYNQLTQVLMESRGIWGAGFTVDDYLKFNLEIRKHAWSKKNLQHLVLLDKVSRVRASAKISEIAIRSKGRDLRAAQISELFVPGSERRRGFSRTMMEMLLERLAADGVDLAVLFSDIPARFFSRFGFKEIEKYDLSFDLVIPAEPRRKMDESRHKIPEAVRSLYAKNAAPMFHVQREADYWDFLRHRRQLWNRLQWDLGREALTLCEDGSAYAWTLWTGQRLEIKSLAFKSPDALADIFAHLLQRHGAPVLSQVHGWLPTSIERLPFCKSARYNKRKMGLFMIKDLTGKNRAILDMKPYDLQFWALDRM